MGRRRSSARNPNETCARYHGAARKTEAPDSTEKEYTARNRPGRAGRRLLALCGAPSLGTSDRSAETGAAACIVRAAAPRTPLARRRARGRLKRACTGHVRDLGGKCKETARGLAFAVVGATARAAVNARPPRQHAGRVRASSSVACCASATQSSSARQPRTAAAHDLEWSLLVSGAPGQRQRRRRRPRRPAARRGRPR